jgi:predicted MFS family arabinose efflux permease
VLAILRRPGVLPLLGVNVAARIPLAAIDVALIVHVHALRGSWALAGLVGGLHGLAAAIASPLLGAAVDRRGQTAVLVGSGLVAGGALVALALVPHAAPAALLAVAAAVAGAAQPPLGACLRTLWPRLAGDDRALLPAAYALEAAALELTFIVGPAAFLALAAVSSALSVGLIGATVLAGTLAFAAQPASRAWRPDAAAPAPGRGGALRSAGVLTLTAVIGLLGVLLGAVEVAVAAATAAANAPGATGPLLALWGLGSLIGGVLMARAARQPRPRDLAALLALLGAAHAVPAASGSPPALGAILLVAGMGVAPLFGAANALAAQLALPGTSTEAFAWLTTAVSGGVAAGAAAGGALSDAGGPAPAFLVAGAAGGAAALLTLARAGSLCAPAARAAAGVT